MREGEEGRRRERMGRESMTIPIDLLLWCVRSKYVPLKSMDILSDVI